MQQGPLLRIFLSVTRLQLVAAIGFGNTSITTKSQHHDATQYRPPAKLIESERAPTNIKLKAQVASRLNQLRDTNLRPR